MLKSQQLRLFAFARHIMTRGDYRKGGGGYFKVTLTVVGLDSGVFIDESMEQLILINRSHPELAAARLTSK